MEGDHRPLSGGSGGGAGAGGVPQARLPELPFGEPRPKRGESPGHPGGGGVAVVVVVAAVVIVVVVLEIALVVVVLP